MSFSPSDYVNFISQFSKAQERLFLQYIGPKNDFDIIIVGSGIGGGILADTLADRLGQQRRILVLEAGSYLYPTHVYNLCRFPNDALARHFGCDTFTQPGNSDSGDYIGESRGHCFQQRPLSGARYKYSGPDQPYLQRSDRGTGCRLDRKPQAAPPVERFRLTPGIRAATCRPRSDRPSDNGGHNHIRHADPQRVDSTNLTCQDHFLFAGSW
jgi:hypothetical protein